MVKKLVDQAAKVVINVAKLNVASATGLVSYQPKMPKALKKDEK